MTGSAGDEPVTLGKISGLYGVRGWIRIYSYTEPREAILDYEHCHIQAGEDWEPVQIAEGRRHGKSVVARLEGVTDRDQAALWLGRKIGVYRRDMPEPTSGEYYWTDLEGLEVVNRGGKRLGTVDYILETGANDVLVVTTDKAAAKRPEREVLIPFVEGLYVTAVDLDEGVIRVDWEED